MKTNSDFEKRMRAGECFHNLRLLNSAWVVLRLDGHRFTHFTSTRFTKPFDETFHGYMIQATRLLLEQFQGLYGYTQSDEISMLLPRDWSLFDRELEKTSSLSAGLASAAFTLRLRRGRPIRQPGLGRHARRGRGRLLPMAAGGCLPMRPQWVVLLDTTPGRQQRRRGDGDAERQIVVVQERTPVPAWRELQ